ncbi:MAG: short-chain fatty acids transporter [Bacteroidia bacterium]|jgi:short-chain fatty acids transporter
MKLATSYVKWVQKYLPSPMVIALLLTVLTFILALLFTTSNQNGANRIIEIAHFWETGFWELLTFTIQMMLMLVLGHTLALSKAADRLIRLVTHQCTSNAKAVVLVTLFSLLMGYVNWGCGLIFGAILAYKVGLHAKEKNISINYPLVVACGYTSLMVWHGGLSGSAPLDVAKLGHNLESVIGVVPISETIFAPANIAVFWGCIILLPLAALLISRLHSSSAIGLPDQVFASNPETTQPASSNHTLADRLDNKVSIGLIFGSMILLLAIISFLENENKWMYFNLNSINFILFGLSLLLHRSITSFSMATEEAIKGSTSILIQFPLYAGIMGILKYSGLLVVVAQFFVDHSTTETFPFFAFLSSALVNIFVPSGGAQWQVQGPILVEAAQHLGVPINKTIMSLAYGDQLTNMLQPFWALPLLGITKLKAKDILPYSMLFMLFGFVIYTVALFFIW